jgi:hypothetical protein
MVEEYGRWHGGGDALAAFVIDVSDDDSCTLTGKAGGYALSIAGAAT